MVKIQLIHFYDIIAFKMKLTLAFSIKSQKSARHGAAFPVILTVHAMSKRIVTVQPNPWTDISVLMSTMPKSSIQFVLVGANLEENKLVIVTLTWNVNVWKKNWRAIT